MNIYLVKKPFNNKQLIGLRQIHLTAPQRLNAEDSSWLVGLIQGDGWFSMTKNGKNKKFLVYRVIKQLPKNYYDIVRTIV